MPEPTRLVWRSDLGWPSSSPADYANPTRGLVVHYDSEDQGLADKDHSACVAYWNWARGFHTGTRGWADVGYSFMACVHGYVMEGRGLYRYQAAQGTTAGNRDYYSVTLASGPNDEITDAQVDAVRELRAWLMEPSTSIAGTVKGHCDFKATACPGDTAYAMVQAGVFERAPGDSIPGGSGGGSTAGEDPLIGLKKGDQGEAVKGLQAQITYAGRGADLGSAGVDGDYGPKTAEALRLAREDVGSDAEPGWGDEVTGYAYAQLDRAVARAEAKR